MIRKVKINWFLIGIVILSIALFLVNTQFQNEINKTTDFYKSKLGTKYILEKDTLTIVDYNSFKEVFILSNNQEINKNLLKN